MIIKNGFVYTEHFTFEPMDVIIDNGLIAQTTTDPQVIDAEGLYVIPGLIDTHFHGCAGYDFCDGTIEAIEAMALFEAQNGITAIAPATMTLGNEDLEHIFSCAAVYNRSPHPGAMLTGIHMEGPYLGKAKKGAQNAAYLRTPSVSHFRNMNTLADGLIKVVTVAPEEAGALEFIDQLKDEVVISIGHTTADYQTACSAFAKGARHVTHLYNAMLPLSHRAPGPIGAALDNGSCKVELICDGIHIDPCMIRASFRMFGDDRIILISDSMMATGLTDGDYSLGGQAVNVKGNMAVLKDGTLAGSATHLMDCLRHAVSFGIPLTSALKCCTVNPAKELGIYNKAGSITPGKYANLVLLDHNLNIKDVYIKGHKFL